MFITITKKLVLYNQAIGVRTTANAEFFVILETPKFLQRFPRG